MSEITVQMNIPELTEAINNLARAQLSAAEAFTRMASAFGSGNMQANTQPPAAMFFSGQTPLLPAGNTQAAQSAAQNAPQPGASYYTYPANPIAATMPATPSLSAPKESTTKPIRTEKSPMAGEIALEDIISAAASLMGAGKYLPLVELLGKFGVQALHQLPKESFGMFADALRGLGAQI